MIILDGANDKIQVVTGDAGDLEVQVSWVDYDPGGTPGSNVTPGGNPLASITTAATTDIIAAVGAGDFRNVKNISCYNNDPVAQPLTIQETDGTNTINLWEGDLLQDECVVYDETGQWTLYDAQGNVKQATFPAATQAEMETASSNLVGVTPGNQHWHPGSIKFWAQVTGGGTPALTSNYNVTSVGDTGTGRMTVTIATDFSSANWCCQVTTFTTTTTGDEGIPNINSKAAGTVEAGNRIITPAAADPNIGYDVLGMGDQ